MQTPFHFLFRTLSLLVAHKHTNFGESVGLGPRTKVEDSGGSWMEVEAPK